MYNEQCLLRQLKKSMGNLRRLDMKVQMNFTLQRTTKKTDFSHLTGFRAAIYVSNTSPVTKDA